MKRGAARDGDLEKRRLPEKSRIARSRAPRNRRHAD